MLDKRYGIILRIIFIGVIISISSCTKKPLTTTIASNSAHKIQQLLVLPFTNNSDERQLGIIATRICQTSCYNRGFNLTNEGDLRIYLQRKKLFISQLTEESSGQIFADLAQEQHVTTLIKGKILSVKYEKIQGESLPVVSLQLELLNASDGKLIASSFLTGHGEDYRTVLRFGVLRTSSQLLQQMIDSIINDWHHKGVFL
jgi:hypothetical protein